jgi:hypothetical protein
MIQSQRTCSIRPDFRRYFLLEPPTAKTVQNLPSTAVNMSSAIAANMFRLTPQLMFRGTPKMMFSRAPQMMFRQAPRMMRPVPVSDS